MEITTPIGTYRWIENWITIPESPLGKTNGRTHGVAVSKTGNIIIFHQADPAVLIYSPEGQLLEKWGNYPGAHGLTLVEDNGVEYLWLADESTLKVVKTTLKGEIVQEVAKPEHELYKEGRYVPTWAAENEKRWGGDGDIWVTDGYGSSLVHRYDASGQQLLTLDGTEGAGRFNCPHGISVIHRHGQTEVYVADRGNKRFQVYDTEGKFLRTFGADYLTSPDGCSLIGDQLLVPELVARVSIIDENEKSVAIFGENDEIHTKSGWPNNREWVEEGKFNSPHGAAADAAGNIYVAEWIIGGRVTKLEKIS